MHVILPTLLLVKLVLAGPFVINEATKITYRGTTKDGVEQYQGIKFAADTSGENRFSLPQPYAPAEGSEIDGTKVGASCPQATPGCVPFMSDIPYQSEDCLNLRIARPADPKLYEKPLPVMVYIYGGGSILGSAYDGLFQPEGIIQQSIANGEPVLYVAMNYRVGVFGFAAADVLRKQGSLNIGLWDQFTALVWIQANIGSFGGDPKRVTIFGQSFGGISVGFHLVAFGGDMPAPFDKNPPFQNAIMTSGAISKVRPDGFAKDQTVRVADALKCTNKDGVVDAESLDCLKKAPLEDLLKANLDVAHKTKPSLGFAAFSPVVDGLFLPQETKKLLESGNFHKNIPLITTWAADDGSLGVSGDINSEQGVLDAFSSSIVNYDDALGQKVLDLYPLSDFEDQAKAYSGVSPQYFRASRITRDLDPTCPLLSIAKEVSKHTDNVFVAELNETRLTPYWDAWHLPWGVSHLSDVPYFFNEPIPAPGDNSPEALARSATYTGSFISFANSGNPVNPGKDTFQNWPQARPDQKFNLDALVIGGEHGTGPVRIQSQQLSSTGGQRFLGDDSLEGSRSELKKRSFRQFAADPRADAVAAEKLAERCAFWATVDFI